ncbi:MAG: YggS family pyridoxal phosphate-dependent enzyme, partial [Cetobacterium sp.]
HFIGNLQKNKVKYIARFIDMIHSINKLSLAEEINKRAKEHDRVIEVLIEINLFQEDSKEGYDYQDFLNDIPALLSLENIKIKGLMTMAPYTDNEDFIRNGFKKLRELKEELNILYFNDSLTELSMGMSNDYKLALEEGATLIRVGSKIFE